MILDEWILPSNKSTSFEGIHFSWWFMFELSLNLYFVFVNVPIVVLCHSPLRLKLILTFPTCCLRLSDILFNTAQTIQFYLGQCEQHL